MKTKDYKKLKRAFANDPEVLKMIQDEEKAEESRVLKDSGIDFLSQLRTVFKGEKGDNPTKEEVLQAVSDIFAENWQQLIEYAASGIMPALLEELQSEVEKVKPIKGVDYDDGKPGLDADEQKVISKVSSKLAKMIPSKDEIIAVTEKKILEKVEKMGIIDEKKIQKLIEDGRKENKIITVEDVIKELKKKQYLEPRDIKGMPINMNDMRWHGSGINSYSALFLTATGDINDTNTQFTFTERPQAIVMNGSTYRDGSTVGGMTTWTWNGGTMTATMFAPVGTGGDIYGIK